jgi:hypothetical protein
VGLERLLDLLRVHLLAAGVDAHRTAAEQGDGAVGLHRGEVAGDGVALPSAAMTNVSAVFFSSL